MSPVVLLAGAVLLALWLYRAILYPHIISPLRAIPNAHWSSTISTTWLLHLRKNGLENRVLLDCHRKLGPVVRTAPNEVSTSCIEDVRTIYSGNFEKEGWLARRFDNYGARNMFSMEDKQSHAERKRMIWQAYSKTHILRSEAIQQISQSLTLTRLLPELSRQAVEKTRCNVVDLCCSWAEDFTTSYLFGIENSSNLIIHNPSRERFFDDYRLKTSHAFWPTYLPSLASLSQKVNSELGLDIAESAQQRMEDWCMDRCNGSEASYRRSLRSKKQPASVYSQLRSRLAQIKQNDEGETSDNASTSLRVEMASEMLDHCAAPQQTTGTVLSFCMHQLSLNPSVQASLHHELQTLLPGDPSLVPSPDELEKLPFLDAVLLETLRLHDHATGPPRITPPGGCTLSGYKIPERTCVSALAYVLHRDETVFSDAAVFRPERWVRATADERVQMQRHCWSFGSGDRQCVALHFAMILMKLFVATVYWEFKTSLVCDVDRVQTSKPYLAGSKGTPLFLRIEKLM